MSNKFDYNSLLFRELRMIALEPSKQITDESITKAMTLNENLKSLGYCFSPNDFALICRSNIDTLFEEIKSYLNLLNKSETKPIHFLQSLKS